MFGFLKSPGNIFPRQKSVDPTNPFDSDTESNDNKGTLNPDRRTASEPILVAPDFSTNPFDDDHHQPQKPSKDMMYKNGFRDSGGLKSQETEELEYYAVHRAEETTKSINNCLRVAEDIRTDATRTLDMLHHQGEQINRTHMMAVDVDKDLSRGEKLLNNLGGMFSKTWKPKKTREIQGPVLSPDNPSDRIENQRLQRENLGLAPPAPRGKSGSKTTPSEQTAALQKVEIEKAKQDDALSDLSNILGDLKSMAVDMGSELGRQNKALDHLSDDVDELNYRVRGANQRARHLLKK